MNLKLKIKIKSLVAETAIIRQEEHKLAVRIAGHQNMLDCDYTPPAGDVKVSREMMEEHRNRFQVQFQSINQHRTKDIGKEMRLSLVAYGFLNGKKYSEVENRVRKENLLSPEDWEKIEAMAVRFSGLDKRVIAQKLAEFGQTAGVVIEQEFGGRIRRVGAYQERREARRRSKITTVDPASGNSEGAGA